MSTSENTGNEAVAAPAATAVEATPLPPAPAGTDFKALKFHFKTEKIRDDKGVVVGEGKKHPSVDLPLPIPTTATLATFLASAAQFPKEVELLLSAVTDQIYNIARQQINAARENTKDLVVSAATLDFAKLSWTAIANMPKSERASIVPADEDVLAFLEVYKQVMPAATGKDAAKIAVHCDIIKDAFKKVKSQRPMLEVFQNAFTIFVASVDEATLEEHLAVVDYYKGRLDKLLASEEKISMDDI